MQHNNQQPALVQIESYLCYKGYAIYKQSLTEKQLKKIRADLTVTPFSMMTAKGYGTPVKYPIFQEDDTRKRPTIYVPYFYGLRTFGPPKSVRYETPPPAPVPPHNFEYHGHVLRPNQVIAVDAYLNFIARPDAGYKTGGLLELYTAFGKTASAMYMIHRIGLPTFIFVQQDFLKNQWIENIRFALPNARIGLIQGEVVDVEDKDIVLCMLQSISKKEYSREVFARCGFLIVDEVHHISSEVFCRALFKCVPKYTLGLSATVDRKDQCIWVLKEFLGDIVYKSIKRDVDYGVVVRGVEYAIGEATFDGVQTDRDGAPLYSCMISRLCETGRRTDFIVKVLCDVLAENINQQVMVLAQNRCVLEYIHAALLHRRETLRARLLSVPTHPDPTHTELANQKMDNLVGYYLGGMKSRDLTETTQKTVVLATFAMAAEALDIKTLTTLFLATPKTDVRQSVGRILRDRNETSPVIWDFIDNIRLFKNQWQKRLTFYKGERYRVETIKGAELSRENCAAPSKASGWKCIYNPPATAIAAVAAHTHAASAHASAHDDDESVPVCLF